MAFGNEFRTHFFNYAFRGGFKINLNPKKTRKNQIKKIKQQQPKKRTTGMGNY